MILYKDQDCEHFWSTRILCCGQSYRSCMPYKSCQLNGSQVFLSLLASIMSCRAAKHEIDRTWSWRILTAGERLERKWLAAKRESGFSINIKTHVTRYFISRMGFVRKWQLVTEPRLCGVRPSRVGLPNYDPHPITDPNQASDMEPS